MRRVEKIRKEQTILVESSLTCHHLSKSKKLNRFVTSDDQTHFGDFILKLETNEFKSVD